METETLTDRQLMALVRDGTALKNVIGDMREHLDRAPGSEHGEAAQALARYATQLSVSLDKGLHELANRRGL